jgi:hypothetical protein
MIGCRIEVVPALSKPLLWPTAQVPSDEMAVTALAGFAGSSTPMDCSMGAPRTLPTPDAGITTETTDNMNIILMAIVLPPGFSRTSTNDFVSRPLPPNYVTRFNGPLSTRNAKQPREFELTGQLPDEAPLGKPCRDCVCWRPFTSHMP